jgi:rhodanese-related sulfurtransferase
VVSAAAPAEAAREVAPEGAERPAGARSIDQILAGARARLDRLTPAEAFAAFSRGAVLVDIRPEAQRAREGGIPGALIVERNVLEWRFDPASDARLPWVRDYDHQVIVFCSEGYTSSLAAAALQDLGLARATDLDGGFLAWAADGLPSCLPETTGSGAGRAC